MRPLTSEFKPFEGALGARVEALAQRCGAADVTILVRGNDDTAVGVGPGRRILIAESSVTQQSEAELLVTVAHELEHHLLHDNRLALAVLAILMLGGTLCVHLLGAAVLRRWGTAPGINGLADPAALPLMMMILISAWTLIGTAIFNLVQQHVELEADRFALKATHENYVRASWQAKHAANSRRVIESYWFYEIFRATHPSDADRVRLANSYRPWARGDAGRYADLCKPL